MFTPLFVFQNLQGRSLHALFEVIAPYGRSCRVVAGDCVQSLDVSFCLFKCVDVVTEKSLLLLKRICIRESTAGNVLDIGHDDQGTPPRATYFGAGDSN